MKNRWLSWPGAKYRQLEQIFNIIDTSKYDRICEPYLGTGAFSLQFTGEKKWWYWAEKNQYLNDWWTNLLWWQETFVDRMAYFRTKYIKASEDRAVFNEMRESFNSMVHIQPDDMDTTALLWCLIYQSTNNLARFNKKGEYNQTWGKGRKVPDPKEVFNDDAMTAIADLAAFVETLCSDAHEVLEHVLALEQYKKDQTVFYYDPPYILRTEVYDKDWDLNSERQLFDDLHELDKNGIPWFMTNYLKVEKDNQVIQHPFLNEIYSSDWSLYLLDRKMDARPTSSANQAGEFIIVGKNRSILR